jgi:zinc protease
MISSCVRSSLLMLVLAALSGSFALAQDGLAPLTSSVVRKNLAPVSNEVLEVALPLAVEARLENGLRVLVLEDDRAPIVSMNLTISGSGSVHELDELAGLADMTSAMLLEGTSTRSNTDIQEEIARLGATLSASSSFGSTVTNVRASGLSRNVEDWFEIVSDILLHPSFPESEFERLREQKRAELSEQRASSRFLADERFSAAVFGGHPASRRSATEASLERMSPEILDQWHRERYAPQNSILSIAGDVDAGEIISDLNSWLGEWERTEYVEELPQNPEAPRAGRIFLVDRPGSTQTTIYLGSLGIERTDPDYIPVAVMNSVLGGSSAARLFLNLREEKGYTYGAYSTFSALKYPGVWRAFADVRTEVTEGAIEEFLFEIRRLREESVPDSELDEVKRSMVARFALSLERPASLLDYSTTREIYGLPRDYWENYPARVMAVTSDVVQSMAEKYLNLETMQVVVVGDQSRIRPVMDGFGSVTVYDANGALVEQD